MTAETVTNPASSCHPGFRRDHRKEPTAMTRSTRLRDAALDAAESGLYVFPCIPRVMWSVKLSHPSGCRAGSSATSRRSMVGASSGVDTLSPCRGAWSPCVPDGARLGLGRSW